jgi:hypothetical protein
MQGATTAQLQKIAVTLDHRGQSLTNHLFLLRTVSYRSQAEKLVGHRASHFDVAL